FKVLKQSLLLKVKAAWYMLQLVCGISRSSKYPCIKPSSPGVPCMALNTQSKLVLNPSTEIEKSFLSIGCSVFLASTYTHLSLKIWMRKALYLVGSRVSKTTCPLLREISNSLE